jgi:hypothetical protein
MTRPPSDDAYRKTNDPPRPDSYAPTPDVNPNGSSTDNKPIEAPPVTLDDFHAYLPDHKYVFVPTRALWPAASVNACLPRVQDTDENGKPITIPPNEWLDKHRPVHEMTWAPGEPMLIDGRLVTHGGWVDKVGCSTLNLYRPPTLVHGNAKAAAPWLELVKRVYPTEADHIIQWLAHRVQRPGEKINHALVLGGRPGIGKDSILEPIKHAIGPWNFGDIAPAHLLGRFNPFVKSVILRINEGRDLGDWDRYAFYEHMKWYCAAPPDVVRCDEKNIREHPVLNVCGVIITTNHKTDGIFLPADDRRHYVAWSERTQDDFPSDYWQTLWDWYARGGHAHVAAYLSTLDISSFNPKAPPPKTQAFWDIVEAGRAPENAELADVLDRLGNPKALTLGDLMSRASGGFLDWLKERKNRRLIAHRLEDAGYVHARNPDDRRDGQWKVGLKRQTIYALSSLNDRERIIAARERAGAG